MPDHLEIDSVIKSYGDKMVLSDIYLKCVPGDIIGMLGRNGCGKSTLLKIIFGTLTAENKFIRIDGTVYEQPYNVPNLVCFLPQHHFLPRHMSCEKIVSLYLGKEKREPFFDEHLLKHIQKSKVSSLSGGELRYLEIKLILSANAKYILLDEPFNGVSPILKAKIKRLIQSTAQNKGVILTDHDYRNVLEVANRYCLMHDGGIKNINEPDELVRWEYLSDSRSQ